MVGMAKPQAWLVVGIAALVYIGFGSLPKPSMDYTLPVVATVVAATAATEVLAPPVAVGGGDDAAYNALLGAFFASTACLCAEELAAWTSTHDELPAALNCGGHFGDHCAKKKGADIAFFEKAGHWYDHKDAIQRPWRIGYAAN